MRRHRVALMVVVALLATVVAVEASGAQAPRETGRLAGATRIETAVAISGHQFPDGAATVYLARADVAADAVAGGSLTDGPVLLVPACGELPAAVAAEIVRLDPARILALGGPAAVCDAILAQASSADAGSAARIVYQESVFQDSAYVGAELFTIGPDGSARRQITSGHTDHSPAWSPDRTRIAFVRARGDTSDVWVVNADGARPHVVAPDGADPVWSPDGTQLAFTVAADPSTDLRAVGVVAADGGDYRLLRGGGAAYAAPSWSPDGRTLAAFGGPNAIVLLDTVADAERVITPPDLVAFRSVPGWSPDEQTLAFGGSRDDWEQRGLYTVGVDGAGLRYLGTEDPTFVSGFRFSPDGTAIAYGEASPSGEDPGVYVIAVDGSERRTYGLSLSGDNPRWSADGRTLVFSALDYERNSSGNEHVSDVYAADVATGDVRRLTDSGLVGGLDF